MSTLARLAQFLEQDFPVKMQADRLLVQLEPGSDQQLSLHVEELDQAYWISLDIEQPVELHSPDEATTLMILINDLNVQTEFAQLKADFADIYPEDEEDDDDADENTPFPEPRTLRVRSHTAFFIGGLKPPHLKLFNTHFSAFVQESLEILSDLLQAFEERDRWGDDEAL